MRASVSRGGRAAALALVLGLGLGLAGCGEGESEESMGCEASACEAEVADWKDAVARIPGVVEVVDAGYSEQRTLRREASVHAVLTLSDEGIARAEELAEQVAEEAWRSRIEPLAGVRVTYQAEGARPEERQTETFSFLLHEDDYTDRWGPRPVG